MNLLQVKGLIKKNIVNYVKSYQIVYDLASIIFSAVYILFKAYIKESMFSLDDYGYVLCLSLVILSRYPSYLWSS